jgi:hypothetical protein
MIDLKVDIDVMNDAMTSLRVVRTEFLGIGDFSSGGTAEATGHRRLAAKVGDFSSSWSSRRDEIAEQLQFLADAAEAMCMTFSELDKSLAGPLTGSGL